MDYRLCQRWVIHLNHLWESYTWSFSNIPKKNKCLKKWSKNNSRPFVSGWYSKRENNHIMVFNMVIEKQQRAFAFTERAFKCLLETIFFFFYQRCWSILYSFSELMHSDQTSEYKRLNFSANYMPEGTLTMQVSMLC